MGDVSWRGGSRKVVRLTTIAQLKMEDVYNFCNVIKKFYQRKITKIERGEFFGPFKL